MRRLGHWNRHMVFRMVSRTALHNPQIGQHKGRLQMSTNNLLESDSHALLLIDHQYLPLRTTLKTWEDQRILNWVKQTDRKKLIMAGLNGSLPADARAFGPGGRVRSLFPHRRVRRREP